jgi:methylated-DNA-[protein]-cysteine S-methyltransferase
MTMVLHALGEVAYGSMDSPVGEMWIATGDRGVVKVSFGIDELRFCHELESLGYQPEFRPDDVAEAVSQLGEYFGGTRRTFELPLDLAALPPFQRAVLEEIAAIPFGQVRSYGAIAEAVGRPRAARAVGTAVAGNPISFVVPCHRVVRSDGTLGEYGVQAWGRSRGIEVKRRLLRAEGINL